MVPKLPARYWRTWLCGRLKEFEVSFWKLYLDLLHLKEQLASRFEPPKTAILNAACAWTSETPSSEFGSFAKRTRDEREQTSLHRRLAGRHVSAPRQITKHQDQQLWEEVLDRVDLPSIGADPAAYASLLRWCGSVKALAAGKRVHDHIIDSGLVNNIFLRNLLVQMYGNCGALEEARDLFVRICQRDEFSWNFMIRAVSQHGKENEALHLFERMLGEGVIPNKFIFTSILSACSTQSVLAEAKRLHARIISSKFEADVLVSNTLVSMYSKCGILDCGRSLFDIMLEKDVVSWNAIISAYTKHGQGLDSLHLFKQMQQESVMPDTVTLISVLDACASQAVVGEGEQLHACVASKGFETDTVVGTALVNMYGKSGKVDDAQRIFNCMPERSTVSWNGMITSYTLHGHSKDALPLFNQMLEEGVIPDKFVFVSMLSAYANLAALVEGKRMHSRILSSCLMADVVCTALVNMYCKSGHVETARRMFDNLVERDAVLWTAVIAGYAQLGQGKDALQLFECMQLEGVRPNKVTYVSVLSACSHAGLVREAFQHFHSMTRVHGITPIVDHCNCIVDLFGRAGLLEEAEDFIKNMSCQPTIVTWTSLLGACRKKVDVERGERATKRVLEFDPENSAPYIMLANIYVAAGRQDDAELIMKCMIEKDLKQQLGRSSIEVDGHVHEFHDDDQLHPQKEEVHVELQRLNILMGHAGYAGQKCVGMNVFEDKNYRSSIHSVKLAIAFGLISTPAKTRLVITKNLPLCLDCHTAIKIISKLVLRNIIVRDAKTFHQIQDGTCSCADYW